MTDGNTYAINKYLDEREDWDALQEVTAELEQAEARIEELEAKLAKAVEALELALELDVRGLVDFSKHKLSCDADINERYRTTLAELRGQDDGC